MCYFSTSVPKFVSSPNRQIIVVERFYAQTLRNVVEQKNLYSPYYGLSSSLITDGTSESFAQICSYERFI